MRGLRDKVVIIPGATVGNIGGATAVRLAEEGAKVLVADMNQESASLLADNINSANGTALATTVDISDESSVKAMVDLAIESFGGVDGLFNVAAHGARLSGADSDLLTVADDVWRGTIDVNLTGYLYTSRHVFPSMVERGGGSIVNTMSIAVWRAEPVRVSYSASKAAIEALTRHTAAIGGKQGIRCNAVAPGIILTEANQKTLPDEIRASYAETVRSTRLGRGSDIAAAVAFLMSDDAAWVNAQTLAVDGGTTIK